MSNLARAHCFSFCSLTKLRTQATAPGSYSLVLVANSPNTTDDKRQTTNDKPHLTTATYSSHSIVIVPSTCRPGCIHIPFYPIHPIMLWVDKHRPTRLEDLSYHDEITERLASLAANPASLPHLFVYGPSGSGKRTRINALLTALFGPSSQRLKLDKRTFTTPSGKSVDIHMITSPHHVELSPGDAGNNDRFVIQDVLKEMASTKNIRSVTNMITETTDNTNINTTSEMKIVVLTQVDRMSKQAQAALRRTMEKYASTCRLILCCNSPSKLIAPLQSRCLGVRVAAPSIDQVSKSYPSLA
jgi:replication factor C subunit 3/5